MKDVRLIVYGMLNVPIICVSGALHHQRLLTAQNFKI